MTSTGHEVQIQQHFLGKVQRTLKQTLILPLSPQTFCNLFTASAFNFVISRKLSKSKFVLNFPQNKKSIIFMQLDFTFNKCVNFSNLSNQNFKTN